MIADKPYEIFQKKYSDEELSDIGRDIHEAFDERFNRLVSVIPKDEYGFRKGQFTVTITWRDV